MTPRCPPRRSSRRLARRALFVLALLALPGEARGETYVVELSNFAVEPRELTIQAGDTVEWRVVSGRHSSTAKEAAWDSGELEQGVSFAQRFDEPGVYPYFCTPHDFMRGTVTVVEVPGWWERLKAWLGS